MPFEVDAARKIGQINFSMRVQKSDNAFTVVLIRHHVKAGVGSNHARRLLIGLKPDFVTGVERSDAVQDDNVLSVHLGDTLPLRLNVGVVGGEGAGHHTVNIDVAFSVGGRLTGELEDREHKRAAHIDAVGSSLPARKGTKRRRESQDCYSATSGLLVASRSTQKTAMGEIPVMTIFSDYKKFGGITVATKTVQELMGQQQILTINSVDFSDGAGVTIAPPPAVQALIKK